MGRFYFVCIRTRPVGPRNRSPGRVGGVREVAEILVIFKMTREEKGLTQLFFLLPIRKLVVPDTRYDHRRAPPGRFVPDTRFAFGTDADAAVHRHPLRPRDGAFHAARCARWNELSDASNGQRAEEQHVPKSNVQRRRPRPPAVVTGINNLTWGPVGGARGVSVKAESVICYSPPRPPGHILTPTCREPGRSERGGHAARRSRRWQGWLPRFAQASTLWCAPQVRLSTHRPARAEVQAIPRP